MTESRARRAGWIDSAQLRREVTITRLEEWWEIVKIEKRRKLSCGKEEKAQAGSSVIFCGHAPGQNIQASCALAERA